MTARSGGICVGYGGLEMAIEQLLPVQHAWHVEFDEAASKVLKAHWPAVPNYGDVTKVDWAAVEPVEVFAGGIPCQGYSLLGKRLGSLDERDLWPVRKVDDDGRPRRGALDAIRQMMPRLVVIENVPGMLTSRNGQDFATILADLDALGYAVSWTTVGACRVGACHHRHRVFIAATLAEVRKPLSDPIAHRAGSGWGPAQFVLFGDAEAVRWPQAGFTAGGTAWEMVADVCGADGQVFPTPTATPYGNNQSVSSGAAVRPSLEGVAQLLPTPKASDTGTPGRRASEGWRHPLSQVLLTMLPTPRASDAEKGGPNQRGSSGDVMLPAAVQPERFGQYAQAVHRHELAYGLPVPEPTEPGRTGRPRLAPEFPEWMQGLPRGWLTDVVGRKDAVRLAGNGVNVRQGAYALSLLPTFRAAVRSFTEDFVGAAA